MRIFGIDRKTHHVSSWSAAHFSPTLHTAVSANRHKASMWSANIATRKLQIHEGTHVVAAEGVLSNAHAPGHDGMTCFAKSFGETEHVCTSQSGAALQFLPGKVLYPGFQLIPTGSPFTDELAIHPIVRNKVLEHAVKERNVAAH